MNNEDIRRLRTDMGRFLHSYYMKFGERKYNKFLRKISPSFVKAYGEPFNEENLRIMEAEYVTFNSKLGGKNKDKSKFKDSKDFVTK